MRLAITLSLLCTCPAARADSIDTHTVQFVVVTPDVNTSQPKRIYLTDSTTGWRPDGQPLPLIAPGIYTATLSYPAGTALEYKFTRTGSWTAVEKDARGGELPNRRTIVDSSLSEQVVVCFVRRWADRQLDECRRIQISGQKLLPEVRRHSTITGDLRRHPDFHSPQLDNERAVLVYLPPGYQEHTDRRYPVLYMHDGNNVFDAATSFTGTEWSADETAERLIRAGRIEPLIIVALANNADRLNEYTAWRDERRGAGGKGNAYLSFIIDTVKPFIDKTYHTHPEPGQTGICGSSLGGLISLHAVYSHPDVFQRAGVVSPALGWADGAAPKHAQKHQLPPNVKLWIDVGTNEVIPGADGKNAFVEPVRALIAILESQGRQREVDYHYEEIPGGQHHEADWAERFDRILVYLYGR